MTVLLFKQFQNTEEKRNASKLFLPSQHDTDTQTNKNDTHMPHMLQTELTVHICAKNVFPYLTV